MRLVFPSFILLLFSCTPKQDRIIIPAVKSDFYSNALLRIDDDLDGDADNMKLVEQKLYYCELLEWPKTCLAALDETKRQKGMTPQLLDQYVIYYEGHQQWEALLQVIDRWSTQFGIEVSYRKQKIVGLVKTKSVEEALRYLQTYLAGQSENVSNIRFAAANYLELEDTLMASYYLGKLSKFESQNEMVLDVYPYLLFDLGYEKQAFQILETKAEIVPEDYSFHMDLVGRYERAGRTAEARNKLKGFVDQDSVIYRISDLYLRDDLWDSAHHYINVLIERDSLDRDAWFTKAKMYEDRGWLSYSLNYYDHVLYLNPNDSIAMQRTAAVRRKIAYLQRLKFEENQLPLPELKSKRIINNE